METLYVTKRREWRTWLKKNGGNCKEVWLVYYKKDSGKARIAYNDAVEEALCFGWIDGKIRKLDEARFAQRFTPRKPTSAWSVANIRRARKLIAEGKMTAAGLAVFRPEKKTAALPQQLPPGLLKEFEQQRQAWQNFQGFPPHYRRMTIGWVASAKKEDTRLKRLHSLIESSARNERIRFM